MSILFKLKLVNPNWKDVVYVDLEIILPVVQNAVPVMNLAGRHYFSTNLNVASYD